MLSFRSSGQYLFVIFAATPYLVFPLLRRIQSVLNSTDYPHGITILSPYGSDKKQVLHFCAQSAEELLKFVEDLKESIAEVSEMEQIRIECECV
ncbi:hypothetical protein XENOCAPTIV_004927 [Xenoophorus captivus]|uniref:IQ motif and SEC7 domain-containing protein n=1 Tax=Xenoophorus captivus TaxID=1517983 RepID=A0ABV0S1H5_9TELE